MKALRMNMKIVLAVAVLAVAASAIGIAVAAVTSQEVLTDTNDVRLRIVRTAADDFDSGWHTHPGPAIVQVQEGFFKIFQGACNPSVVGPGETFIEIPDVPVRAVAKGKITWTTTLILPNGVPAATPASDPCS